MIISDIRAIPLCVPMKEMPPLSSGASRNQDHVLIIVFTDDGIAGHGEAFRFAPKTVCCFIEEVVKPLLIGRDPTEVEKLWNLMYQTTFRYGRKGLVLHCISGTEIALWDIAGKYRNLPVYEMFGGANRKIKAYASLPRYRSIEDVATVCLRCVDQGYDAIKLHVHNLAADIESVVRTVRIAVGDAIELMVDVNGAWSPEEAVEKLRRLEQYRVLWVEEPVYPMDDYEGLNHVRGKSNILIAAGENEYTMSGFKDMISRQAVDIVQPDVTKAGGLSECHKILALARASNLRLVPHASCFGPGIAATAHLMVGVGSTERIETKPVPLEASFIQPSLRPERGYVTVPDSPGLGIELDEPVIRRYSQ